MISNRRIGSLLTGRMSARKSLKSRMPMTNPFMSKSLISGAIVFFVAFFAAFFSSSVLTPVKISDATNNVNSDVSFEGYFVKVQSSDVNMQLITNPVGAMTVVQSTVKTVTNSPNGYNLYLSMSSDYPSGTEKSTADKQKNGLYLNGDLSRTDGMLFNAASGKGGSTATASLAPLTDNTWGYAVDKNSTGAPTIWQNEDHSTMSSATPTNDKFAAVPKATEVDLIQETTSSNLEYDTPESEVQDSDYIDANLYYGIRGTAVREAGSYSNTIAYTAVGKVSPSSTINFDPATYVFSAPYESMVWDDTVTIQTQIYTSAEDLGTATVTLSGGPDNVSGLSCSNPSLSVHNNLLNVTCTLPQAHAGTYDVLVYLNKYGQIYTGSYNYYDPYNVSYDITINSDDHISTNVDSLSIPYGGTATVEVTPGIGYYLSYVICPSGYICSNYSTGTTATSPQTITITNNNTTSGGTLVLASGTSSYSQMQDQTAIDTCKNATVGTSYTLIDNRDNSQYTVRKLADGKCWMVQNLRLVAPIKGYIDSSDSNVNSQISWNTIAATEDCSGTNSCVYYEGNTVYGAYYDWSAATALSGTPSMVNEDAPYSICPKGWKLPSSGEYISLYNKYPSWSAMLGDLPSFVRPGYHGGSAFGNIEINGYYWSRTASDKVGHAYTLYFLGLNDINIVSVPNNSVQNYNGLSVRCIAQ